MTYNINHERELGFEDAVNDVDHDRHPDGTEVATDPVAVWLASSDDVQLDDPRSERSEDTHETGAANRSGLNPFTRPLLEEPLSQWESGSEHTPERPSWITDRTSHEAAADPVAPLPQAEVHAPALVGPGTPIDLSPPWQRPEPEEVPAGAAEPVAPVGDASAPTVADYPERAASATAIDQTSALEMGGAETPQLVDPVAPPVTATPATDNPVALRGDLGPSVLTAMQEIKKRVPGVRSASLSTAEGINVCALGFDEWQVDKMAALSASLFSVGSAAIEEIHRNHEVRELDAVVLESGSTVVVGVKIPDHSSHTVLLVAADGDMMGLVLVGARAVAGDLADIFATA